MGYRGARLVFIALVAYGCVSLLIDTAFYFYDTSFVAPFSNNTEQIYERLRQENPSQTVSCVCVSVCVCVCVCVLSLIHI